MFALCVNRFEADPDEVTDILDLQPTFVARKGEVSPQSGRPNLANLWQLDAHPDQLFGGEEHETGLAAIAGLLSGREQRFARLREVVRPDMVSLYGGLHVRHNEQCGVWLDPEQMRLLADCQIEWGLDIYTAD